MRLDETCRRLTRRRLRLWLISRALFGKRAHQIHEVPACLFWRSISFARHLPLTIADDPKELAVGRFLQGRRVAPVAELELHVRSEVTLAVAAYAVTHRAIVAKKFARSRQSFRRWRHGILFGGVLRRHFWLRGSRLFLHGIRLGVGNRESREQNRTQDENCLAHRFLLTGWAGRGSGFGWILSGFYALGIHKERIKK